MQIYPCVNCKKDSAGGGSIIHGGMFMKMCSECFEDEETMRKLNEFWRMLEEKNERDYEEPLPIIPDCPPAAA